MHCLIVQKHIMGHCMLNILYLSYPTHKSYLQSAKDSMSSGAWLG